MAVADNSCECRQSPEFALIGFNIGTQYNIKMTINHQTIEVTASEVSAELKRRGIGSDERVTVTIEADQELVPGRRASRARVVAAGFSDADVDALIKRAQHECEPPAP